MKKIFFLSIVGVMTLLLQKALAADLAIHPEIQIYKSTDKLVSGAIVYKCSLTIYVENLSSKNLTIPTKGYSYGIGGADHQIDLSVFFPEAEKYRGKRIVRTNEQMAPVSLKPNEVAEIKIDDFFWPGREEGVCTLKLIFKIHEDAAREFGYWFGQLSGQCTGTLKP